MNSKKATKSSQWATKILKSYIIKRYSINKEKLKNPNRFGKDYFDAFQKFRIEQDKQYISDFDRVIDECKSQKNLIQY